MRKNYRCIPLLLFILLGLISCKKDTLNITKGDTAFTNEISAAKDWYETQLKTAKTSEKTNIGFFIKHISWEKLENTIDGKIALIPFTILDSKNSKLFLEMLKNEKGEILSAKYVFLLSEKNINTLNSMDMILNKNNINNFTGAVVEYNLNNTLLSSITYIDGIEDKNKIAKIEMSVLEENFNQNNVNRCEQQTCTAWYWVLYNSSGQIIDSTYLYTTCACSDGTVIDYIEDGTGGVGDVGSSFNYNPTYTFFSRVNSSENWSLQGSCKIKGMKYTNSENNYYTSITEAQTTATSNCQMVMGTCGGPIGWPYAESYCVIGHLPNPSGLTDTQHAFMIGKCSMKYINHLPNPITEYFQGGHTWFAPNDF